MTQTIPFSEVEPKLAELVERAREALDRFVITREGRAEAVLLGADDFEGLLETLEILSDTEQVKRLVEAEAELASGGGRSLADVLEELRNGHRTTIQPR